MSEPRGEIFEPDVGRPLRMLGHVGQSEPLRFRDARDREPAIVAETRKDAVRRGRLVRRAIAVACPDASVRRPVENGRAADEEPDLALRRVDPLPFTGPLAMK